MNATLKDTEGVIDLRSADSVKLVIKDRSESKVLDQDMTITDAVNGEVRYAWQSGDTPIENAGVYRAEIKIIDLAGDSETVPNDGFVTIEIEEDIE